jgi:putative oxidoreductase
MALSLGLFLIRLVVGLTLAAHGSQKLFGWFGGNGYAKTSGWLEAQGLRPGRFWALVGGLGEFAGGILFAIGLLTPLAAIALAASMLMAVLKFHWSSGFWNAQHGYEYPLILLVASLAVGLIGAGSFAIDALIGFSIPTAAFLVLLVIAVLFDVVGIAISRQRVLQRTTV